MAKSKLLTLLISVLTTISIFGTSLPASASLGGSIDYSNERIVPIFAKGRDPQIQFSGFLYSPRIIFTTGHAPITAGNYVGTPNSKIDSTIRYVKVVKKIIAPQYVAQEGLRDFAIYVLEKDLAPVEPFPLMTKEIEAALIAENAKVQIHGYGIFRHEREFNCSLAFNPRECIERMNERSAEPRMIELTAHASNEFQRLVGYTREKIKDHFLMYSGPNKGPCPGDSGGSILANYQGKTYYVGPTPNGMNVAACGRGTDDGTGGIHYSSQIHYHLDILKEAEEFVAAAIAQETANQIVEPVLETKTITCVKGKTKRKITAVKPKCPAGYKKKK